jgi:hypothetical protein
MGVGLISIFLCFLLVAGNRETETERAMRVPTSTKLRESEKKNGICACNKGGASQFKGAWMVEIV